MDPTKERKSANERHGRTESIAKRRKVYLGTLSPDPWGFSLRCQSQRINLIAGAQASLNPSLVLAPELTLRLLPSRALSFAPAACSVSATAILRNDGTEKELDYRSAFRHAA
jgi:hypothetical protein